MEDNIGSGEIRWTGSHGDFLEFVMILTDFSICINQQHDVSKHEFDKLCDSLGETLITLFNINLSPYTNFSELRKDTRPSYKFTRKVIEQLNDLKENDNIYSLLESKGITPSYEYMTNEIIKWKEVEKYATLLWLYLKA
jgi:hypothetical protein